MAKVLVFDGIDQAGVKQLEADGYEVVSCPQASSEDFDGFEDVEGMIAIMHPITGEIMDKMPNLKVIARFGVGYDNIDLEAAKQRGIVVTNTPGGNAEAVAETAVTLALMAGREFEVRHDSIHDAKDRDYMAEHKGFQLSGKVVGILGFGHIAQKVNDLLTGFQVQTLVYARHDRPVPHGKMASLDEIFKNSDYIISTLPATPQTTHLINADAFKQMKKTAIVVNVGRGAVIDEAALLDALKSGEITSAGLDVVEKEPISPENPLLVLPNAYVLPHVAGFSSESETKVSTMAATQVEKVLSGQGADYQVN
ncbi:phosphoglycerate dehydrogenase [Eupransor demetentiae]|uniref:Phosphoglycerate dehydrogenase or related dehydrogenase (SerA) n=1 Tax=Eupransor demetentiae TaxID=3109584 RepID=A0ABM9N6P1_9LACO|nr:Phosphoglycerate dehydrogenase or related dehydrogenase (SerA) [Lactobacillaceae bacterium LMG 33000]